MKHIVLLVVTFFPQFSGAQEEIELHPQGVILPRTSSPTAEKGMIRFDTMLNQFTGYDGNDWVRLNSIDKQQQINIAAAGLVPGNHTMEYHHTTSYTYADSLYLSPTFYGSVQIPVGSTVTSVSAFMFDRSSDVELVVHLYKNVINRFTNEQKLMARISSSKTISDQYVKYTDSSINDAEVKTGATLFVRVHAGDASTSALTNWPHHKLRLVNIIINYTLP